MRETLFNEAKSEHCQLDKTPSYSIVQLELNFKTRDIETVELVNDSKYLQRVEMLWGDSAKWV